MLAADAWGVLADPSQLSAAIVNLAVNARDAMPGGGKLTIETANVTLDEAAASADSEVKPGAVRDDRGRPIPVTAFRPTSAIACSSRSSPPRGSAAAPGLGSAWSTASPSRPAAPSGSTARRGAAPSVKLYLPRVGRRGGAPGRRAGHATRPRRSGGTRRSWWSRTIALVQGYVIAQLGGLGYRTLVASDGAAALALVDQGVEFDLLFTDMIMPGGMNGRELADAVRRAPSGDEGALHLRLHRRRHRPRRPSRSRRGPAQKAVPEGGSGAEDPRGAAASRRERPPAAPPRKGAAGWLPPRSNSCARWSRAESAPMPGL